MPFAENTRQSGQAVRKLASSGEDRDLSVSWAPRDLFTTLGVLAVLQRMSYDGESAESPLLAAAWVEDDAPNGPEPGGEGHQPTDFSGSGGGLPFRSGIRHGPRKPLTPEAIGLAGEAAAAIRSLEVLAEDADGDLRVVFVQLRSLTAKSRNDLARVLGRTNVEHLLILTSNFDSLEFVLLAKRRRDRRNLDEIRGFQAVPLSSGRGSQGRGHQRAARDPPVHLDLP